MAPDCSMPSTRSSCSVERQGDPSCPDGELEDRPVAGELGEELHGLRLVTSRVLVIPCGDVRAEAPQWVKALHGDPFPYVCSRSLAGRSECHDDRT